MGTGTTYVYITGWASDWKHMAKIMRVEAYVSILPRSLPDLLTKSESQLFVVPGGEIGKS